MFIQQLYLNHFRNYPELSLTFSPGINCLVGSNGAGKTNVLDALHYIAFTRGFRSSQDRQAIQKGEKFFINRATVDIQGRKQEIQCNVVSGKGKKVLVNQRPIAKMSEHIGQIPLVAILPFDTELVNGPSAERRKFLDMLISQYDHSYLYHLIQYEKILSQRNALLKLFAEQRTFDAEQVGIWDSQLIPHGISISKGRQEFLQEFLPIFSQYFKQIVSQYETPTIHYKSQIEQNDIEGWLELLAVYAERDRVNQYSGAGIHRDDLTFKINDHSVRNFGSQGQQKTFVIALKLAQYQLLEAHAQRAPILLLDDIFDKLDEHRLGSIAAILDQEINGQIFITDTTYERLASVFADPVNSEVNFYKVDQGTVNNFEF